MTLLISLLQIINVVIPDSYLFLWIAASVADTLAGNPNCIKTLSANRLNRFFIKSNSVLSNGSKIVPKNPLDCPISCNWVFDDFKLADKQFAKASGSFETCALVNNNLCGKLFSSLESPITFDESFEVTSVPIFIPDFNS